MLEYTLYTKTPSHHDSLGQRIAATVVVVDAVVGDLFPNLTANEAHHCHCSCQAKQPQIFALRHCAHRHTKVINNKNLYFRGSSFFRFF